jgi:hypothetical protein
LKAQENYPKFEKVVSTNRMNPNFSKTEISKEKSTPIKKSKSEEISKTNPGSFFIENEHVTTEVKEKITFNKLHQRPLTEGILKSYKVNIKECLTEEKSKSLLLFFNELNGYIKTTFISNGFVNLIVEPDFNSVNLKDKMLEYKLEFNFMSETYFLK